MQTIMYIRGSCSKKHRVAPKMIAAETHDAKRKTATRSNALRKTNTIQNDLIQHIYLKEVGRMEHEYPSC